tara:strand:- start:390 stop:629 length:240 start_codon:yes stop_codon:yes gene_type:complete
MSVVNKLMLEVVKDDLQKQETRIKQWEEDMEYYRKENEGVEDDDWMTSDDYENKGHLYGIYETRNYMKKLIELLTEGDK